MGEKYEIRRKNGKLIAERQPNAAEQVVGAFILIMLFVWIIQGLVYLIVLLLQFFAKHPKLAFSLLGTFVVVPTLLGVIAYGSQAYVQNKAKQASIAATSTAIAPRFMPTTVPATTLAADSFWYEGGMCQGRIIFDPDRQGKLTHLGD